jgi:hypothetical protein
MPDEGLDEGNDKIAVGDNSVPDADVVRGFSSLVADIPLPTAPFLRPRASHGANALDYPRHKED